MANFLPALRLSMKQDKVPIFFGPMLLCSMWVTFRGKGGNRQLPLWLQLRAACTARVVWRSWCSGQFPRCIAAVSEVAFWIAAARARGPRYGFL